LSQPQRVCVYCSSSDAVAPAYFDAARELGAALGARGHTLIYGGANIGLMGALAKAARGAGAPIVGVIPRFFDKRGLRFAGAEEIILTEDMRERKAHMERRATAFLALPGGFGTFEELLEVLTLKQLGAHAKPIVLINTLGFYDSLIALFERLYAENFAKPVYREHYHVAPNPAEALDYLERYAPPPAMDKWF